MTVRRGGMVMGLAVNCRMLQVQVRGAGQLVAAAVDAVALLVEDGNGSILRATGALQSISIYPQLSLRQGQCYVSKGTYFVP